MVPYTLEEIEFCIGMECSGIEDGPADKFKGIVDSINKSRIYPVEVKTTKVIRGNYYTIVNPSEIHKIPYFDKIRDKRLLKLVR